jgi:hypothetical protein
MTARSNIFAHAEFPCSNRHVSWLAPYPKRAWLFVTRMARLIHWDRAAPMIRAKYAIVSYILHMWISRDVEGRLKRSAKTRPVIVLTGARQTGKTSTFRHLFPDYAFVSLDLPT